MMKYGDATRYLEFAAAQTYMLLARSASGGKSVAIIIVSKNGHKAHKVERSTFDKEDDLQRNRHGDCSLKLTVKHVSRLRSPTG